MASRVIRTRARIHVGRIEFADICARERGEAGRSEKEEMEEEDEEDERKEAQERATAGIGRADSD